jgi:hypothetical protein
MAVTRWACRFSLTRKISNSDVDLALTSSAISSVCDDNRITEMAASSIPTSPTLPRFLFHTYMEEKQDESEFLTWLLLEAEKRGHDMTNLIPEEGTKKPLSVRTCHLVPLAKTVASNKPMATVPADITQKGLNVIKCRRAIAAHFASVTNDKDLYTKASNDSHIHRADEFQRAFDIIKPRSLPNGTQSVLDEKSMRRQKTKIQRPHLDLISLKYVLKMTILSILAKNRALDLGGNDIAVPCKLGQYAWRKHQKNACS